jgi:hypothetical protein
MGLSKTTLAAIALTTLSACKSPVDATLSFHQALVQRDGEKALGLLSAATRSELEQRARDASAKSAGAIPAEPAEMIVQGDLSIYPEPGPTGAKAVSVKLLSEQNGRAMVEVVIGQSSSQVALAREAGGWKLELPLTREPSAR